MAGVHPADTGMQRPAVFWSDVHFLMIAVKHLGFTLQRLGRGAPRLDKDLSKNAVNSDSS